MSRAATPGHRAGYRDIALSPTRRFQAAALLAVVLALVLAPAASAAKKGKVIPPPPPSHLLLIHGGSFLYDDPDFQPRTEAAAVAAGFVPHYVSYPLGDLPAAVLQARADARELRQKVGVDRVYAFGASAGGTLAALLAGDGLVGAAAAKAPVTDLVGWEWPLGVYGLDYFERIAADPYARYRLSPLRRPASRPLLVIQGRADRVVPLAMNEAFADKFPRVHLRVVAGGHATEKLRPWLIDDAMGWLASLAERKYLATVRSKNPPKVD